MAGAVTRGWRLRYDGGDMKREEISSEDQRCARVLEAARFAARHHAGQRRKGASAEPYIVHPLEVAQVLAEAGEEDSDVLVASVLHDVIEDTPVSAEDLADRFGKRVADFVREVSDDKSLPKVERKRLQIAHAPRLSPGAKRIRLADKISNVRSMRHDPPAGWDAARRKEYVRWCMEVVNALRGIAPELEARFDAAARDADAAE